MKRRRFLSHAMKSAAAAVCSKLLPSAFRASLFSQGAAPKTSANNSPRPQLALTIDDPTLTLGSVLKWQEANSCILKAISEKDVRAALFVCGMRVDGADGAKLLTAWDQAGHLICNHSYSHKFYGEQTSYADFAVDFLKNEKVIAPYHNRAALFRYPFLKEGDTAEKRDRFRALLKERGYRVGHVTIDASDWYVSQRFVDRLGKQPKAPITPYRDYLVAHLLDRAAFYRQLTLDVAFQSTQCFRPSRRHECLRSGRMAMDRCFPRLRRPHLPQPTADSACRRKPDLGPCQGNRAIRGSPSVSRGR